MDKRIGFGLYQSCGSRGSVVLVSVLRVVVYVESGYGVLNRVWKSGVVLCMCYL